MSLSVILETPRLILREKVLEDAPFFMALNSDPLVVQYTGDGPFKDLTEAETIVNYVIGQYRKNGYGRWLVSLKETGKPLGWCGLKYHEDSGDTDIGYRLMQKYWGKGYATEASRACLAYGFEHFALSRIIGRVVPENTASIQVLKKLGMTFFEDTYLDNSPAYIYHIVRNG